MPSVSSRCSSSHASAHFDALERSGSSGVLSYAASTSSSFRKISRQGREVELGEAVAVLGAAEARDQVAGPAHVRGGWVIAHELEGEIGLDGAGEVRGTAGKEVPSAVGLLETAKVVADQRKSSVVFL